MSTIPQDYIEKREIRRQAEKRLGAPFEDGKTITLMQVCVRCKKEFPYNSRRRACPYCLGILRTKIKVDISN